MSGPSLARSEKLSAQHFTLKVLNPFAKAAIFTHVFWLLPAMEIVLTFVSAHFFQTQFYFYLSLSSAYFAKQYNTSFQFSIGLSAPQDGECT